MIIPINKDDIPYRFDIELAGVVFTFEIDYNVSYDFFSVDMHLDGEPIFLGKKLVLNQSLFAEVVDTRIPEGLDIIPKSSTEQRISWDNFGDKVQLEVIE